ncbi:MAG: hypothetical protein M0042_06130 [Nitrospiraceae bacterium]|nr:hypothetical protein [Nitrospiraceae bacterium]
MEQQKRRKTDKKTGVKPADEFCMRFGAVAVRKGFATSEQVLAAMKEQIDDDLKGKEHRLLGTIMYERGWISEANIELVLLDLKKAIS